jgi:hypothetical protein
LGGRSADIHVCGLSASGFGGFTGRCRRQGSYRTMVRSGHGQRVGFCPWTLRIVRAHTAHGDLPRRHGRSMAVREPMDGVLVRSRRTYAHDWVLIRHRRWRHGPWRMAHGDHFRRPGLPLREPGPDHGLPDRRAVNDDGLGWAELGVYGLLPRSSRRSTSVRARRSRR